MPVAEVAAVAEDVIENIEQVIVGKHDVAEHILSTVFARGHLLLEDVPGVGKTMLARAVAKSIDCSFKRVQFTPDLLPSDVTGVNVFNQQTREFDFQPGPVFANIVLGDEINRAPPKTQSALLEAMEEEQVTVDGETHLVPQPFTVFATQNAIERDRTYELPVAQVDRFMKNLQLGYPTAEEESEILERIVGFHPIETLEAVTTAEDVRRARATVAQVAVEAPVREYATALANHTRERAELGVSPRGTILLLRASQARAVLDGRDYVLPDDIQAEAGPVLAHRIRRNPDEQIGEGGREVVEAALAETPVE
ncbi:MAG: MoxR family ATPase [Halobacteriales archaeon]|nr:MoxR family ATPase [Halobacteriales archaeon]